MDVLTLSLIAIFILLLVAAFFSCSETALTVASKSLIHQMEQQGNRRAVIVHRLQESKDRLLGAILLTKSLATILATALAVAVSIVLFGLPGIFYATLAMTIASVIFAEILPKTYAIYNGNRAALVVAPVIRAVVTILGPIVRAIQWLVKQMLVLFGARSAADVGLATALTELRGAIEMHTTEDVRHERAMLRSILDLADVEVAEIMTHRKSVIMIDAALPVSEILDQVLASPYTRIPLWRDDPDNVVGVLHAKALLKALRSSPDGIESAQIMSLAAKPWFIPDTTSLLDQLQAFRARREHFALVVDEYGSLLGVVTLEDILEEIVGEISDEHDVAVRGVRPQANGSYVVDGTVTIRDLNREFDWALPDDNASTIAGLILYEARHIPKPGQTFLFHGFRFEILRRQRNQITTIRLTPP